MRKELASVMLMFFVLSIANAQDGSLLIQQYRRGPALKAPYMKWNIELEAYGVYASIQDGRTNPKLDHAFGGRFQYRFTKSFGFTTGLNHLNMTYQFDFENDNSIDRITYLAYLFTFRVFAGNNLSFDIGGQIKQPLSATNTYFDEELETTFVIPYAENTYKNTLGMVFGVQYRILRPLKVSLQFRFAKRFRKPLGTRNNNTGGVVFGFQYLLRRIDYPKKVRLDLGLHKR